MIVVLGHAAESVLAVLAGFPRVLTWADLAYRGGKSGSISIGVEAVPRRSEGVMVLAVDQPRSAKTLERLVSAHEPGGLPVTLPVFQGRRGRPPIIASSRIPELLHLSGETQGLRRILKERRSEINEVSFYPEILLNLNTPEEYRKAQTFLSELRTRTVTRRCTACPAHV